MDAFPTPKSEFKRKYLINWPWTWSLIFRSLLIVQAKWILWLATSDQYEWSIWQPFSRISSRFYSIKQRKISFAYSKRHRDWVPKHIWGRREGSCDSSFGLFRSLRRRNKPFIFMQDQNFLCFCFSKFKYQNNSSVNRLQSFSEQFFFLKIETKRSST